MNKFKLAFKYLVLLLIGGMIYVLIELLFRGRSHFTMFILGGVCFVSVGLINEVLPWNTPFQLQMLLGGSIITVLEFISGCILNLYFGLGIWDYSDQPGNILGQICPLFSLLWVFLSGLAIVLDDYLRYRLFNEEKPYYTL